MPTSSPFEALAARRLVPVIEIADASLAVDLTHALVEGGLPVIEITLRTEAGIPSLAAVARSGTELLLAAGTVVSRAQAQAAVDAGAQVIISPGLNREVIEYCLASSVPVLPGVCTPSEIETARAYGLSTLKFFPAEAFGGTRTLGALSSVYGNFRFVPTGGVSLENLRDYLKIPNVIACGGSFMAPKQLLDRKDFAAIAELVRRSVATAMG